MIKKCEKDLLEQCVDIAYTQNKLPQNNSAYCSNTLKNIHLDFDNIFNDDNNIIVGYFENDELMGILSCFMDIDNKWVDCAGPFFKKDFNIDIAKEMFLFAKNCLSSAVRFNFYFNVENKNVHQLMSVLAANQQDNEYILSIKRDDYIPQKIKAKVVQYSDKYKNDVINLHNSCFHEVYVEGKDIITAIGKTREVFCAIDEKGEFVGYGVLGFHSDRQHYMAEIFAVKEEYRGKGYGWGLLNTVVDYGFTKYNCNVISLVVDKLNTNARDLYYSCGFKLLVENESFYIN